MNSFTKSMTVSFRHKFFWSCDLCHLVLSWIEVGNLCHQHNKFNKTFCVITLDRGIYQCGGYCTCTTLVSCEQMKWCSKISWDWAVLSTTFDCMGTEVILIYQLYVCIYTSWLLSLIWYTTYLMLTIALCNNFVAIIRLWWLLCKYRGNH